MLEKINQLNLNYQINRSKSIFNQDDSSNNKDSSNSVKESTSKENARANITALRGDILKSREQAGFDRVTHDFGDYDHKSFLA